MSYIDTYNYWKNNPNLEESLREEINNLSDKEIEDCFYTDVKFQTAGMRGLLGVGTNRLNIHTIRKATQGFANYLNKNHLNRVAIGYDNRHWSKEFAYDCANLLASNGIETFLFDSLRPTPELSFTTRFYKCAGGIMITASHNPKEYNGYKLYDETGCQLIPELADKVIAEIDQLGDIFSIKPSDNFDKSLIHIVNKEVDEAYWAAVESISLRKDVNKNFKIAYSPEHGTSFVPVMTTMKHCGFDIHNEPAQSIPDPNFGSTKTPNPEEPGAYEGVLKLAKDIDADLILVCDPDGDRMGVGCKHHGEYKLLNGNQTGALLLDYILMTRKELGIHMDHPCMYNTIVTSDIGEAVGRYWGCDCEKTLTGFKYIGDKVRKYEVTHEKNYAFGYEESYGSLISPFVRDKDATQACLMLAEACGYYLSKGMTLLDAMYDIYARVGAYADSQFSIMLPGADGAVKLAQIMVELRKHPLSIPGNEVVKIEDYKERTILDTATGNKTPLVGYDLTDVLKYFFKDGSFVAVRPSGTEPKCKVYLSIKDKTYEDAIAKMNNYKDYLKTIIK